MTPRRLAIAAAVAAVALAVVAVPVLQRRSDGPGESLQVASGGGFSAPPSSSAPPSPTPLRTSAPTASRTTAAASVGASAASNDDAAFGAAPGVVSFPYQAGRADWSAVSNGVHISVHISPTVPKAGQALRFDVTASAASSCCYVTMIYGDGFQSPQGKCSASGASTKKSFDHVYNKAGRKRFAVGASRGGCASNGGGIFASLDVAQGQTTAQGPALPTVHVDTAARPAGHEDDSSYVTISGEATDDDGYVNWFVLDWGDGSTSRYDNGDPCQRSMDGWPTPSWGHLPGEPHPPTHHYAKAGTFRVTLTAYSTSCEGTDVQHASAHLDWAWAPPETATPVPS